VDRDLARRILAAPAVSVIHSNRRGEVSEVLLGGERFARKRYQGGGTLRGALRRIAARRTWRVLLEGRARGLPLPEPVALDEDPRGAAIVTRWFAGDHLHLVHARSRERFAADRGALDEFLAAIADAVVALLGGARGERGAGIAISTGDLAPHNLLVGEGAAGWRVCLVDLDDARLVTRVPPLRIIDNLMQLGHLPPTVPVRDRLRLLDLFLERGGATLLGARGSDRRALRRLLAAKIARRDRKKSERHRADRDDPHPFPGWGLDREGRPIREVPSGAHAETRPGAPPRPEHR
jgi:hypothetical protein